MSDSQCDDPTRVSGLPPFAWNFCPTCGVSLTLRFDGETDRPHCAPCGRFFYRNPIPAVCCFITRGNDLLLTKRGVEPCIGQWSLPGGFVELDETTEEAAVREMQEETGLDVASLRLLGVSTQASPLYGAVTVLGYAVGAWSGVPHPNSDVIEVRFFPPGNRPPLPFKTHRDLIALFDVQASDA